MPGGEVSRRLESHVRSTRFDRRQQRLIGQVAVPHGRLVIGVSEDLTDRVQMMPALIIKDAALCLRS